MKLVPDVIVGLEDVSDEIVRDTLLALAALVPVCGGGIVSRTQRRQIFSEALQVSGDVFYCNHDFNAMGQLRPSMQKSDPIPQKQKDVVLDNRAPVKVYEPPSHANVPPPVDDPISSQKSVESNLPTPETAANDKEAQKEARRIARQERNEAMKRKQLLKHSKLDNV